MTSRVGEFVEIDGLKVELIRSSRRKTLSVEVGQGGVKVRAPERMRDFTIRKFLHLKRHWIERHLASMPAPVPPIEMANGGTLSLLGEHYHLQISEGRKQVFIDHNANIVVPVIASHLPVEQTVKRKLIKWYKQRAQDSLEQSVIAHAERMNGSRSIPKVKVRDYKRRWGSCDHRGDLSFNWRIVMAPQAVVDYVVVHELAHLQEFNHSKRFWRIVEQEMPDWRMQQQWLSQNGGHLYRF